MKGHVSPMVPPKLVVSCSLLLLVLGPALSACSSSKSDGGTGSPAAAAPRDAASEKAAPPKIPECRNGKPSLLASGSPSGFVTCDGYSMHRSEALPCPSRLPRTTTCAVGSCKADAECTTKPNGFCGTSSSSAACFCNYGCLVDADCGPDHVCVCGEPMGHCESATCTTDAQCGNLLCLSASDGLCGLIFTCQTPKDTCASPTDCKSPDSACQWVNDHRECRKPAQCP